MRTTPNIPLRQTAFAGEVYELPNTRRQSAVHRFLLVVMLPFAVIGLAVAVVSTLAVLVR